MISFDENFMTNSNLKLEDKIENNYREKLSEWENTWRSVSEQMSVKEKVFLNLTRTYGWVGFGIKLPFALVGTAILYAPFLGFVGGVASSIGTLGYYALTKDPDVLEFTRKSGMVTGICFAYSALISTCSAGKPVNLFEGIGECFEPRDDYKEKMLEKYKR